MAERRLQVFFLCRMGVGGRIHGVFGELDGDEKLARCMNGEPGTLDEVLDDCCECDVVICFVVFRGAKFGVVPARKLGS